VTVSTCPKANWRQPETSYALDPYAPRGSVRTVAVTVTPYLRDGRRLVRRDTFTSVYVSVGPTRISGPGSSIPGSYFVLPRVWAGVRSTDNVDG
jgi:hypothetical protein